MAEISDQPQPGARAFNWMPNGWYDQNMLTIGELYRDYILPSVDETNRLVSPKLSSELDKHLGRSRMGPYNIFAKLMMPALTRASQRSARGQSAVDEVRVACALERYRLEHDKLPDTLDALTPQFIAKIPNDLFDGKPLRYKKNTDDSYILYSIGWNGIDDGGTVVLTSGKTLTANPGKGDWVWKLPPP